MQSGGVGGGGRRGRRVHNGLAKERDVIKMLYPLVIRHILHVQSLKTYFIHSLMLSIDSMCIACVLRFESTYLVYNFNGNLSTIS